MKVRLNQLNRTILRALLKVAAFADKQEIQIYLVGGAVRDLILSKATSDIDLVLEGDAIAFGRKLCRELGGDLIAHTDFKTATLDLKDGPRIDLVTARSESYARPGALPKVKSADLKTDALRRDFTINSLALSINMGSHFCEVVDHTGGLEDLQAGRVRVMHEQSFMDDPTRIFRAVRYEQRHGFRIERSTLRLIKEALARDVFASISGQRYLNEMLKIFEEATVVAALKRLRGLGVLDFMCPKFRVDFKLIAGVQKNIAFRIYPGNWERISVHGLWWLVLLG
ncbi:MAG: hypothetical protein K8I00_13030, partial [Candidatus Omnitrophica bacterium]|nr:hypothetical protein [Candidatus Omnitrophota bacterium]